MINSNVEILEYEQTSPSAIINFDNVTDGTPLHNIYSGASFYETNGSPMFAQAQCRSTGGPCNGQSPPNYARAFHGEQSVVFLFAQPANITSFDIIAIDSLPGLRTNLIALKQEGVYYSWNVISQGSDVPIAINVNQLICGGPPCNKVTEVFVYGIADAAGLGYDNVNYTTYAAPTPTPPDCRPAGETMGGDNIAPCPPSPTPQPSPTPNPPTNLRATNKNGLVNLAWDWIQSDPGLFPQYVFKVERSDTSNGPWETILQNGVAAEYEDTRNDLRIDKTRYYRVKAVNANGSSPYSNIVSGAPLSACHEHETFTPPTMPSPNGYPFAGHGWTGFYKFEHGFSVRDVALEGRYMAQHMGVPSMEVATMLSGARNLDLDKTDAQQDGFLSKLINFKSEIAIDHIKPWAQYCVSSPSGQESWVVKIEYKFDRELPGDTCEPGAGLPCARFYPYIEFEYDRPSKFLHGTPLNPFTTTFNQRLHYKENNDPTQVMSLIQDCDNLELFADKPYECLPGDFPVSKNGSISPEIEGGTILVNLLNRPPNVVVDPNGSPDNIHQTGQDAVSLPGPFNNPEWTLAGCPSCVHDHWRWTAHWLGNPLAGANRKPGTFSGE
jgi:hypothetical protein